MANRIARAREQVVFAVAETTRGTLVAPAASDLVVVAGYAKLGQQPSYTDSPEIVDSRDIIADFQDRTPAGTWSFPIIIRPSGSLGVEPNGSVLYESLLGTRTVNAGASVVYSPAIEKPSFSLWVKKSHSVMHASGCTVGKATLRTGAKGGLTLELSGGFMQMGWAGEDTLAADAAQGATDITVGDARKYTVGAMVQLEGDDNGGSGYQVTAVNTTTNVVTLASGLAVGGSAGDAVSGWLPTGSQTSNPLENRKSSAEIAGSSLPIKSMEVTITDDVQYLEDEISTDDYPTEYVESTRQVGGSLEVYFRQDDLVYFQAGRSGTEQAVALVCGDTAGSRVRVEMPRARLAVPDIQEADPTVALQMPLKALGTDGEDSISFTFT